MQIKHVHDYDEDIAHFVPIMVMYALLIHKLGCEFVCRSPIAHKEQLY